MSAVRVRAATASDLDRLVEIHATSFPDARGPEQRRRQLTQPPLGSLADLRVAEDATGIVGHAVLFALGVGLGGRDVPAGGIASLGVAPESRGRGVASALLAGLERELIARGTPLALLYPFREGFYARRGWAPTSPFVRLELGVDALARPDAPGRSASQWAAVALDGGHLGELAALYESASRAAAGRVARTPACWERHLADERRHWLGVRDAEGRLAGYAAVRYEAAEPHARTTLVVDELVARDRDAGWGVVERLHAQRDQVDDVRLTLPLGDPWLHAFHDAPGTRRGTAELEHPMGRLAAGPMVRLVDAAAALAARAYACDGALVLEVVEGAARERLRLVVEAGLARVERVGEGAAGEAAIEVDRAPLASVVAAGVLPATAAALGSLRGSPEAIALADALFAGPRWLCLDPF